MHEIAHREVSRALQTMDLALSEAVSWLGDHPALGDNGVAEELIRLENILPVLRAKVDENATTKEAHA